MRSPLGRLLQSLQPGPLDRFDLRPHYGEPGHVALHLGKHVRRDRQVLRCAQCGQPLRRPPQQRLEAADAEPDQRRFQAVGYPGALSDEIFALAARALGVLVIESGDHDHAAVAALAAQPAQEHAHQHAGVQPVGLGPTMLARHCDARGVNDVRLNAASPQPSRQPKPVAAAS